MKFKGILTLCLAGASIGAFAQSHVGIGRFVVRI